MKKTKALVVSPPGGPIKRYEPGDRVRYSTEGLKVLTPQHRDRLGTVERIQRKLVVDRSQSDNSRFRDGQLVHVLWDGRTSAEILHEDFVEEAEQKS